LTTTSYAILGLLAIKPWSTYELAKQMRRDLHYFWPRAESNLYAEPKRLVDGGYARAQSQPQGKRRRTVYTITAKGEIALERWLAEAGAPARRESESMVKLFLAPNGSKQTLLNHLKRLREDADTRRRELRSILQPYLEGNGPFPERLHVTVVCARLVLDQAQTEINWAKWAISEVEQWPDTETPHDPEHLLDILQAAIAPRPPGTAETHSDTEHPGES
jgi:DNA-binding PadR family transcriptional regulator